MSFIPDASVLALYSVACFALFVTPGPDMSLFLARTITGGRAAGVATMLGAMAGCCVHTLLAAIGLSAVLAASTAAFTALKIAGALYLLWLAIDAVRNGSMLNLRGGPREAPSLRATFLTGLGVNLTNPKVVLFFVTFLPQFVEASDPHASGKLAFLGLYFVVFSAPLAVGLILIAERFVATLTTRPKLMRGIDWLFAGVFSWFAIRILMTQGK